MQDGTYRGFILSLAILVAITVSKQAIAEETFAKDSVLHEAGAFLGEGTAGVAEVIEKLFAELGRPNAYIKGEEASGAFGIGARYGNGSLQQKSGGRTPVHWSGPSIGFDAGANASKVFVLVYHLPNADALFQRFPALDGSFYFVGGVSANYHQSGDIILAPIRLGVGLRAGVNIGYMKYTRKKTWNPL
ncbi:MAG: DUF1134 domain-containing protein [Proteobacteria bacterium]|nr:DUF1134 domain-containing protein [Pseudomonadota bacterium]